MNQRLVDVTVRNITTGDEEDIRVLELAPEEYAGFPDAVREQIRALVAEVGWPDVRGFAEWARWGLNGELIRRLLLPYISRPKQYERNYEAWERWLLGR